MASLFKDIKTTASAVTASAVTPSDTVPFSTPTAALYIGVSGDVKILLANDSAAVVFKAVPVGPLYVQALQVFATGTTATNILALY